VALFPGDAALPVTSSINFMAALNRANNAILPLSRIGTATFGAGVVYGISVGWREPAVDVQDERRAENAQGQ
jgi:hypothetical protein